ncbi:MAG TPA: DNA methyltransferase [Minicystis sp.]|nr:DNA methyltransferase [Minicystis sp.]
MGGDAPELRAHHEWIGLLRPVGLVVSVPAMVHAGCRLPRSVSREREALVAIAEASVEGARGARVDDFRALATSVLGWEERHLADAGTELDVALPAYGDVLRPSYVVRGAGDEGLIALVEIVPAGTDFDRPLADRGWQASPEVRFERLLRERGVPLGVLFEGASLRLVHAPRGESSGHVTFPLAAMCEPEGRVLLGAMLMLLSAERVFSLPEPQRLPAILRDSRRHQGEVSTRLCEQVLSALDELLRGFTAGDEASGERRFRDAVRADPRHVYGGLLATVLRLVFLLYAEDRDLLPSDPVYVRSYAVTSLFDSLREDAARDPDGMDHRFGAWARLLTLFRLVHDGASHGALRLPARRGRLFDPDAHPFLEGRQRGATRSPGERVDVPRVADGVVLRVLSNLLLLDGERLSYRALDVEQLGSVYESMMGFGVEILTEPSIALRPQHAIVGLASLLATPGPERLERLSREAGCKLSAPQQQALKDAATLEEIVAALGRSLSPRTPHVLPPGAIVLQPSEERRRSGSHYTPRTLTEPMVETTLRPILEALGDAPRPARILELTVCDPAMGSGAFLVAACRALGDALVASWQLHGMPPLPPDEDPVLYARRLVAARCLYGVDKNPFAVDLAKLSLWLVTLARDQSFTFVDHALRHGDSLVGLSRDRIASFSWEGGPPLPGLAEAVDAALGRAAALRRCIRDLAPDDDDGRRREALLREADEAVAKVRRVADLVLDAFFGGASDKERKARLAAHRARFEQGGLDALPEAPEAACRAPFHWELEFPEVFDRQAAS